MGGRFPHSTFDVLRAYAQGFFPMRAGDVLPARPPRRLLLPLSGARAARTSPPTGRDGPFQITFDLAFDAVAAGCGRTDETWASPERRRIYGTLHRTGTRMPS